MSKSDEIRIFPDGDMWCALIGPDLQEGVAGFGTTPEKALHTLIEASKCNLPVTKPVTEKELALFEFAVKIPDGSGGGEYVNDIMVSGYGRPLTKEEVDRVAEYAQTWTTPCNVLFLWRTGFLNYMSEFLKREFGYKMASTTYVIRVRLPERSEQ